MKANELMIGDWVRIANVESNLAMYRDAMVRVCEIYKFDDYEKIKVRVGGNTYKVEVSEELEPIPLTPEILEKNGMNLFNRKTNSLMEECKHSDIFEEDDNYRVELSLDYDGSIRWTINGDEYTIMPLDYVHQLQHALRLCGIEKEIKL